MTTETYWKDAYQQKAVATVQKVENERFAVLDESIFYPQGGGQPGDKGTITQTQRYCEAAVMKQRTLTFQVQNTKRRGEEIVLELDQAGIQPTLTVECTLDWKRRYALMRMHTSAHILAKVIFDATGSLITGNQLEEEQSRMDFNVAEFSRETAENYIQKTNEIIRQKLSVTVEFLPYEKAIARPELFRLKDVLPKNIPELRIVSIGQFDVQADGGTHVKNTSEIGKLELTKTENKGKENRRMYWQLKPW